MKQNSFTKLLSFLRAKPTIGGLEISDTALRFVVWDGMSFQMTGLRLPPGLVVAGQIKDREHFVAALRTMHAQIVGAKKKNIKINAIISLSSIGVYTQMFTLPFIEGESLDKAVQLNIQMISPLDFSEAYSGWQFASKDADKVRLEILSAFANRGVIDEFVGALQETGFLAVAVESRALSITRLLKEAGADFDVKHPYILMSVDGSGLDFLIIRHGQLHFDYFNSWLDLQGAAKEISPDAFKNAVVRNLHQVLNFYNSHWQEPINDILLITTGFHDEVVKVVEENFALKTRDFALSTSQSVTADWFVALGSAVRGLTPRRADKEISLLGIDSQEEFGREQVLGFLHFWRILMPAATIIFLIAFLGINFALGRIENSVTTEVSSGTGSKQASEMAGIEARINIFNRDVGFIAQIEKSTTLKTPIIQKVADFGKTNGITITRLYYQSDSVPIAFTGSAISQDNLLDFKKSMENEKLFKAVDLPISKVQVSPSGVTFSMTFSATGASSK